MATISFRRIGTFMGCVDYEVFGDGMPYRVEVRHVAGDYERSIFNGSEAEWRRDVVAAIGLLRRRGSSDLPIASEVVVAFNAWRLAEYEGFVRRLRSEPARYGHIADDDPILVPPPVVRSAHYVVGTGWLVDDFAAAA